MPFHIEHVETAGISAVQAVFLPNDPPKSPPIIIFLHGSGERGTNPAQILGHGLDAVIEQVSPPAITLFPQCTLDFRAYYGEMEQRVFDAIDHACEHFQADANRVYLVGYSMGATSTLYLAARHPHRFAGIVSIAVGISYPELDPPPSMPLHDQEALWMFHEMFVADSRVEFIAEHVKQVPIWFIHGDMDTACPVEESRSVYAQLKKLGANTKLTEYAHVGHDSLLRGLQEPGLFEWLLSQKNQG